MARAVAPFYMVQHNGTDYAVMVAPNLSGEDGQAAIDPVLDSFHWAK